MLLLDTLIILGAYTSTRLHQRYKEKKQAQLETDNTPSPVTLEKKDKTQHYLKVSSAAVGLTVIGYVLPPVRFLNFAVITYTTLPILREVERSLVEHRKIKSNVISATVTVVSLAANIQIAAALQAYVYHLSCRMIARSKDLSTEAVSNIFSKQPTQVWVLREHVEVEIDLEDLNINDIVAVKAGEIIPIDGTITKGIAMVDQQALTGEAIPVEKETNDTVFASTLVVSGWVHIKVQKTGRETTVAKLGEILQHTTDFKTDLQLKGEKWSDATTLPLLTLSAISIPYWGIGSATGLLFSSPTDSIRFMTSLQTYNYMTLISSHSILIKDGRAIEAIGKVDVVLFDKTGTLTEEQPIIDKIKCFGSFTEKQLLRYAAAAEMRLTHPIAKAIVEEAQRQGIELPTVENAFYKMGHGISVHLENHLIQVGSGRFMEKEGLSFPKYSHKADIFIAIDSKVEGSIRLKASIRPEAPEIIRRLRQQGIKKVIIISGDHKHPTQKLANALNADSFYYEALPQHKADIVKQLQQQGHRVAFIGDGINDALAMRQADASISLSGASSIAVDTAQVVFMDGNLIHLNTLFSLSSQLQSRLHKTLMFWAGYGVTNMALSAFTTIGLAKSTLIFVSAFSLGLGHGIQPLVQLKVNQIIRKHNRSDGKTSKEF